MHGHAPSFLLIAAFLLSGGPAAACASGEEPAPAGPKAAEEEAAKAAAEAAAARDRAAKAAEEAIRAVGKALRAKRRALEASIRQAEDELDRLLEEGKEAEAAAAERKLEGLHRDLATLAGAMAGPGRPAAPAPVPGAAARVAPGTPVGGAEGLPPLAAREQSAGDAVAEGLDWLVRHQSPGGYWDADGFPARCAEGKCPGTGGPLYDPGLSGLATLSFLGAGETHQTPKYGHVVRSALKYLKGIQDAEGCFGPRTSNHFVYNHALASLAMAEAYGLTASPLFKDCAQKGADFILLCQNPYLGWRYGVRPQDNDTAVTGLMVMALKSAKVSGLAVDENAFAGAIAWLDKVTEPEYGRAGYTARGNGPARPQELMDRFPADRSEAITAEAVLARILCGQDGSNEWVRKGTDLCLKTLPRWDDADGSIDLYYWYFGTLAMFQRGGDSWKAWNTALLEAVPTHQRGRESGCARGSWDPADPWGAEGGRVYSTALATLMMEVCARAGK